MKRRDFIPKDKNFFLRKEKRGAASSWCVDRYAYVRKIALQGQREQAVKYERERERERY